MEETKSKKAYGIDFDKIQDGEWRNDEIVYCEGRNEARKKLLQKISFDNLCLRHSKEELNYLNIPVVRKKYHDLILFEGTHTTTYNIASIIAERERIKKLENILSDESVTYCYIRKGSYYRPGWAGYTDFRYRAGVYKKQEAVDHVRSVSACWLEPINNEEHNKMINEQIEELKNKLL